jgi:(p)ppGpp synthase/HD superfamily hydrolase
MDRFISLEHSFKIEKAISFLVSQYNASGHNPKPVILHSIRVGMQLLELGYDVDTIVVGILHDLLEDTDTTIDDIERIFGGDIARYVQAVSFRPEIANYVEQYKEMFQRTIEVGKIAIVVKAADLYANSLYIHLIPSMEKRKLVLGKSRYFLDITKSLSSEPIMVQLEKRYQVENESLAKEER